MSKVLEFAPPRESPVVEPLKVLCPSCRTQISSNAKFCHECGYAVVVEKKTTKQRYTPQTTHTKVPLKNGDEIIAMERAISTPTKDTPHNNFLAARNKAMFSVGINIGLRASDLTTLKVSHFFNGDMKPKSEAYIVEVKTNKGRTIPIADEVINILTPYIKKYGLKGDDFIFPSQTIRRVGLNAGSRILQPRSWNTMITDGARSLGWNTELYGGHTIRKTFGYMTYMNAVKTGNEPGYRALSVLCKIFGHSSEATTLRYIGLEQEEIQQLYNLTAQEYGRITREAEQYENDDKDEDV